MISDKLFESLKFGQTAYIISRPGDFADDGMATMQGPIIEKSESEWGYSITIRVEKCAMAPEAIGKLETCHNVYKVGERKGIGTYVK